MNNKKPYAFFLFAVYASVLFILMFYERSQQSYYDYNIVPFKIITLFINLIRYDAFYFWYAVENLFGNIILFIPLGMFLPYLFPKLEKLYRLIFIVVVTMSTVEIIQYITRYGTGDIDDVILNTIGAIIGYFIYMLIMKHKKKLSA